MRRISAISLAVVALLSWGASGMAGAVAQGRVNGSIRLCGGPAPSRCFLRDGTVSALRGERVVATEKTEHARFSFALAPGRYTLLARTGGTRGEREVSIVANRTLHANIVIPVP
jgi:hypothetical protein